MFRRDPRKPTFEECLITGREQYKRRNGESMNSVNQTATKPVKIVVVGSINMDLVVRMLRLPRPGETVTGNSFETIPGGKGANQAVAAARLGALVSMIGRVGDDTFGATLRQNLVAVGVDTQFVVESRGSSSGVALIGVEQSGANAITVVPAANGLLSVSDVMSSRLVIAAADALIVQLETPIETVAAAIRLAQMNRVLTVLDPAPAPQDRLPHELLGVDVLSPNQTEAEALTGIAVSDWPSAEAAARALQRQGAHDVVIKMGSLGALICSRDGAIRQVATISVNVIDTTAAGDAFTAAMTVARCEGQTLPDAVRFACHAGTVACMKFGAQPAMPTREELRQWIQSHQDLPIKTGR